MAVPAVGNSSHLSGEDEGDGLPPEFVVHKYCTFLNNGSIPFLPDSWGARWSILAFQVIPHSGGMGIRYFFFRAGFGRGGREIRNYRERPFLCESPR